jgi:hypothetical protein
MIQNVLQSIGGIGIYGIISICLFFGAFVGIVIWAACLKKPYVKSMRDLPLEGEAAPETLPDKNPHPQERYE